ncbi:shikimate/quinate 5-dehydrogenase [Psychromonas sp. CNPT3]|uniref:glutamyl-tRNA reductase n=1 Tax=Psychromonas sp. CNPT3 TaxID=314282 RepID=UPI00006E85CB|nr:glutamyl-tRNA reductase [Psychromonas sp. CNPT3]AGH81444.1 shikimate/quinate 5-dehydrogenase [Psychromonas sp. CNPT3]
MPLFAIGINHQSASVSLREKVAFSPETLARAYQDLLKQDGVLEAVIVSTCNRSEIYCNLSGESCQVVINWLCHFHGVALTDLVDSLYCYTNDKAVQHLFRVASGLDSLVLGEPQILGQIKQAFVSAGQAKSVKKVLQQWFQQTFTVAKQVRTDTQIGANAISVAFAAVCLAKQIFSDLAQSHVLLIGAGETIELVGKYLVEHNVPNITIANRTLSRAMDLVDQFDAQAITLEEIPKHLPYADIIISSTASPLPIIGKGMVESALKARRNQPMLFIDIAVPRDIEEQVNELHDVYLYSVDDLHGIIEENKQARQGAAIEAEKIIELCVIEFITWIESLKSVESIRRYREKNELLRDTLLEHAIASLHKGNSAEKVMRELAFKLTNKIIHDPTRALKLAGRAIDDHELQILRSALGLNDE